MGKAPSPPAPTDPKVSSAADQQAQTGTAIANTWMSNANEYSPYGSKVVNRTGTQYTTDAQGRRIEVPTFTTNTTFSPAEQKNYDLQNELNWSMSELGIDQLGRVSNTLANPISAEGLPEVNRDLLNKDYEGYRQQALDTYKKYMSPELDRQSAANYTDLANRGISEGSEAYREAVALQNRQRSDADLQMIMGAGSEADRARSADIQTVSAQDTGRERALQERTALRDQPINEISALTSGTQVNSPQFTPYQAGQIRPTDVAGQYNNYDAMMNQQYQQKSANRNAMMSGLFGLGSAGLTAGIKYSDARLKSNIVRVADDPRGFGWYEYDIDGRRERGVIAQEVAGIVPGAVLMASNGFLMVNYGAL